MEAHQIDHLYSEQESERRSSISTKTKSKLNIKNGWKIPEIIRINDLFARPILKRCPLKWTGVVFQKKKRRNIKKLSMWDLRTCHLFSVRWLEEEKTAILLLYGRLEWKSSGRTSSNSSKNWMVIGWVLLHQSLSKLSLIVVKKYLVILKAL